MIPEKRQQVKGIWIFGLAFMLPLIIITLNHWGYKFFDMELPFVNQYGVLVKTILCAVSGMLAWLFYVVKDFRTHIFARLIAGIVTGAGCFWTLGGYIYARGNPDSLYKIELIFAFLPGFATGMLVYYLLSKDKSLYNNLHGISQ